MATVKLQAGKVLLKGGKVSCECCNLIACLGGTFVRLYSGQSLPITITPTVGTGSGLLTVEFNNQGNNGRWEAFRDNTQIINTGSFSGTLTQSLAQNVTDQFVVFHLYPLSPVGSVFTLTITCPAPPP